ncbi:MAG TPA: NBR1-Ig-like domain-containing protein [Blastocatellia bacterium]|nr:NBR1-Ig-like domain-containing protein [Blastocatellia bacterium]
MKNRRSFASLIVALACVFMSLPTLISRDGNVFAEEGINDAAFVSQSVPATMTAGQSYMVTIKMRNIGTSTWSRGSGYKLGSKNPTFNMTWGINRVSLPMGSAITPGKEVVFSFEVVAPSSSGLYDFQWQMVRESRESSEPIFFGQLTTNIRVNVTGGGGGPYDAQFVSQTVVTPMVVDQTYSVSITMRNIGTTEWTTAAACKLASQNPPMNTTWGLGEVALSGPVAPGADITFTFDVTAPSVAGIYDFQWQMYKEGYGFFGQISSNIIVNVGTGSAGANDAAFISQTAPTEVTVGREFGVTITLKNTGTNEWTAASGYRLATQNPPDNTTWGINRVLLPAAVPVDTEVTFAFNLTAPTAPGVYNLQWQMIQEGVGLFGTATTNIPITVSPETVGDEGYGNNLAVPTVFAEAHGITGLPTAQDTGLRPRPEETNPTMPYFDTNYVYFKNGVAFYPQQAPSTWQADWADGVAGGERVVVNWSDNLLNTSWMANSVIRVENIMYISPTDSTMMAYTMGQLYGHGTGEMWGADTTTYLSNYRTVFSVTPRLKIEKINGPGGVPIPGAPCGFNGAIYEKFGLDGPGGYGAEVNVSGNLIFGFNWALNQCSATTQEKLGWWRLTFSLDPEANYNIEGTDYTVPRNVFFDSLDPGDMLGTFFKPKLESDSVSVLEIRIGNTRNKSLSPESQSFDSNGGSGSVNVTVQGHHTWTATTTDSFISITNGTGTGSGVVTYTVAENFSPSPRTGTIRIDSETFTVMQGAKFADVGLDHPFFTEIGKLSARGVTLGCDNGVFCPDDPVARDQMAAFIMRALGERNPPLAGQQRFADVLPGSPFYGFIDRIAGLGITLGCGLNQGGQLIYCPSTPVTREQMAAFLIRSLGEFNPPMPESQRYLDVPPSSTFYRFIDRLAVLGITNGCGGGNYCPSVTVTRGQMAAFLVRAFKL